MVATYNRKLRFYGLFRNYERLRNAIFSATLVLMNNVVLKTLEFDKVLEMLAFYASSDFGKEKCLKLKPLEELSEIEEAQVYTEDALNRLLKSSSISFFGSKNMYGSFKRLEKGTTVSTGELLKIASLLENTARVKSFGKRDRNDTGSDSLDAKFELLEPLSVLSSDIRRCILSEDEISDDASSNLKNIRRRIKQTIDKVHTQLGKMVSDTYRNYLQDAVITMRDGRYCIPVKSEYKGNVPGMIHDQSGSASTYFIEPAAIVNLNNELRELELEEAKEIEVIIASLSAACSEHIETIRQNLDIIAELDFIFAKARLALDMNAVRPIYNTEKIINLKKARHPLIDKKSVVPIDINLGGDFDLLVITGPNTGGKTVALKTLGLISVMGQAGLHIPALHQSELTPLSDVYADIGDEQSIEQSLSTFSSHMKRIVYILKHADSRSLCLFDELGAGTDPTEGAALAIAILSKLHNNGILTAATTHYSELKIFALRENGVMNASCEFDVNTLRPTYRLLIGVPGKSNAFAISKKLGLRNEIIEDAKSRIEKKDEDFEDVIASLEKNRVLMEREKDTLERYRKESENLKNTLEEKQRKLNEMRDKMISDAKAEARDVLKDAKAIADEAILYFQKQGVNGDIMRDMEDKRRKLREKIDDTQTGIKLPRDNKKASGKITDFKLGDSVRIISMNLNGSVATLPDDKGNLFVLCGIIRMQTNVNDLELIMDPAEKKKDKKASSYTSGYNKAMTISTEINLLGLMVDEALSKLDKYLDDAYLSHLSSVRIVHGKGTGALRTAVHSHLKRVKYVKSFKLAEYGEGDAGVTIVEFK